MNTTKGSALIVGAGPGLGRSLAAAFAGDGHRVALIGRDGPRLKTLADDLVDAGHSAVAYSADAAAPGLLATVLAEAVDDLGEPDVLVYNAAFARPDRPTGISVEDWATSFAVNVTGAAVAATTVIPMLREGRGTVLFTGGGMALNPSPDYTSLSVGKAALRAYAHALHEEQREAGVHVTTVTIRGFLSPGDARFDPDVVAESYLELHHRPQDQWRAEYVYG
ncbi:SDR family NAD(P)-dependent oxidoreductase [Solihabitans fulvus]|nr:SDR family NAD(P)-dependent oxidoreductase [Solihabitans fulvus]